MALEMSGDVRGWFYERLGLVLRRHAADPSDTTRLYLVELLARYATQPPGPAFGEPLAFQLAQAMEAEGTEKLRRFRVMGDTALYSLGFFEDNLCRRGISRSYVVAMGGRAYRRLEALAPFSQREAIRKAVYGELASDFEVYAHVLEEVRESTELRTPQDIVKLYERYKRTRNPRLAERLRDEGVFLQVREGDGTLH